MRRIGSMFVRVVILALSAPVPASAEWLVLRDGTRLETRGAARVEGRRVLFTDARGTLAALPAAEVDLPRGASRFASSLRSVSCAAVSGASGRRESHHDLPRALIGQTVSTVSPR